MLSFFRDALRWLLLLLLLLPPLLLLLADARLLSDPTAGIARSGKDHWKPGTRLADRRSLVGTPMRTVVEEEDPVGMLADGCRIPTGKAEGVGFENKQGVDDNSDLRLAGDLSASQY